MCKILTQVIYTSEHLEIAKVGNPNPNTNHFKDRLKGMPDSKKHPNNVSFIKIPTRESESQKIEVQDHTWRQMKRRYKITRMQFRFHTEHNFPLTQGRNVKFRLRNLPLGHQGTIPQNFLLTFPKFGKEDFQIKTSSLPIPWIFDTKEKDIIHLLQKSPFHTNS